MFSVPYEVGTLECTTWIRDSRTCNLNPGNQDISEQKTNIINSAYLRALYTSIKRTHILVRFLSYLPVAQLETYCRQRYIAKCVPRLPLVLLT